MPVRYIEHGSDTPILTVHGACSDQWRVIEPYPRAIIAVLDRSGHGLPHKQDDLLNTLMAEWLVRVSEHRSGRSP